MFNRTWTITLGVAMALAWICGQEHRARRRDVNRDCPARSVAADPSPGVAFDDGPPDFSPASLPVLPPD